MKKILSLCLAAVLCTVLIAGCAQSGDSASASADASASQSASPESSAKASAASSASATSSASAEGSSAGGGSLSNESSSPAPSASSQGSASSAASGGTSQSLGWFFEEWPKKLEALNSSDMTERLEVSEALSTMIAECRSWKDHRSGDTVTIELPSHSVVVTAVGSDTALENASIECLMTNLEEGVSPSMILFTVGAGALVEVLSGEVDGGLDTVNDAVAALLSASSDDGVLRANPVTLGNASFDVSLDTETKTLKLTGTPE